MVRLFPWVRSSASEHFQWTEWKRHTIGHFPRKLSAHSFRTHGKDASTSFGETPVTADVIRISAGVDDIADGESRDCLERRQVPICSIHGTGIHEYHAVGSGLNPDILSSARQHIEIWTQATDFDFILRIPRSDVGLLRVRSLKNRANTDHA